MERFRDVFDYPHELIVHGEWDHALCHKVVNGCRGVVETEQKHYRGAPCGVFWRERFSSSRPRHVISVEKGGMVLVFPRRLGS